MEMIPWAMKICLGNETDALGIENDALSNANDAHEDESAARQLTLRDGFVRSEGHARDHQRGHRGDGAWRRLLGMS